MNKIRLGDQVAILSGRDKGRQGKIKRVIMGADSKPERVLVEGINLVTKHTRANPQNNDPGGLIKKEMSLHVSNVAVVETSSAKPMRVRIKTTERGRERDFFVSKKRQSV